MVRFLARIVIADFIILSILTVLLLHHPFQLQTNDLASKLVFHLIFTTINNTILFINPPLLIVTYYAMLFFTQKTEKPTMKSSLFLLLNFIILYFTSWFEMLLLIANDVRV